jgi:hypothetical protein
MTIEELQQLFATFKTETGVKLEALEAANAEKTEEIGRLRKTKTKLLGEKKKLKKRDESEDEDEDEDETPEDRDALSRVQRDAQKKIDALTAALEAERGARNKSAIDATLKDALSKINVAPHFRSAVEALMKATRKVTLDGDAVLIDGKPASDALTEWAQSDDGKAYIAAPSNGGGIRPARPNNGGTTSDVLSRAKMSPAAKAAYVREHGYDGYEKLSA